MIDQWYYWRGGDVLGPISGVALAGLGASGGIQPDDTVWREGYEHGVPAGRVKNLFTPVPVSAKAMPVEEEQVVPPAARVMLPKRARAVAGKGTIIMGQNGKSVRFKMKCTTCGHEDNSVRSVNITRGSMRTNFHCSKCRKVRPTEMTGVDC
jgi:ribosomal protein S14